MRQDDPIRKWPSRLLTGALVIASAFATAALYFAAVIAVIPLLVFSSIGAGDSFGSVPTAWQEFSATLVFFGGLAAPIGVGILVLRARVRALWAPLAQLGLVLLSMGLGLLAGHSLGWFVGGIQGQSGAVYVGGLAGLTIGVFAAMRGQSSRVAERAVTDLG